MLYKAFKKDKLAKWVDEHGTSWSKRLIVNSSKPIREFYYTLDSLSPF